MSSIRKCFCIFQVFLVFRKDLYLTPVITSPQGRIQEFVQGPGGAKIVLFLSRRFITRWDLKNLKTIAFTGPGGEGLSTNRSPPPLNTSLDLRLYQLALRIIITKLLAREDCIDFVTAHFSSSLQYCVLVFTR